MKEPWTVQRMAARGIQVLNRSIYNITELETCMFTTYVAEYSGNQEIIIITAEILN
jgi:hypothetical protein